MNTLAMQNYADFYSSIMRWNATAGNDITALITPNDERRALYNQAKRVIEEAKEARDAHNLVNLLDAGCDLIVVGCYGSAITDRQNWLDNAGCNQLFTPRNIQECIADAVALIENWELLEELHLNNMCMAVAFWRKALTLGWGILNVLHHHYQVNVINALHDVCEDNWSKFISIPDDPSNTVSMSVIDSLAQPTIKYYELQGQEVVCEICGDYIVFRRTSDNKIMKPVSYINKAALNLEVHIPVGNRGVKF